MTFLRGAPCKTGRRAQLEGMSKPTPTKPPRKPAPRRRMMKHRLSDIAGSVYAQFLEMTARERRQARLAISQMNGHNCAWVVYEMRSAMLEFISTASYPRKRKARP